MSMYAITIGRIAALGHAIAANMVVLKITNLVDE
jgi:hypothetical protein